MISILNIKLIRKDKKMKKIVLFFIVISLKMTAFGQEVTAKNNWGAKMLDSNFHLGLDLQTKYVWRGMEMMTTESTPVVFPQINYQNKNLMVYIMGGYALNGKYSEVDLGLSYTYKIFTIALNDYYYPTTTSGDDQYFNFKKSDTGHWLEGVVTITPEKIPAYLTISNFFYGADKNSEGKQAYSTYMELGTYYDFLENNRLMLIVGTALNESCYNGYEHGFGICNVEMKYTHTIQFNNGWSLPISTAYIINPVNEKSFVNFSISMAF